MTLPYFAKVLIGTLIFFSLIFISAGKLDYWQGILYVTIGISMLIVGNTFLKIDANLQKERAKPQEWTKNWDKKILLLSFVATLAMYIIAGLDSGRFHWSPEFHRSLYAFGAILTALWQLLFLIAQRQNQFFSSTVRIQTDRGHKVHDTWLYTFVRHPAYFGSFIQTVWFPLIFWSLWSIIPVSIAIFLLLLRTYLEDATLQKELDGYKDYSKKTRYKILPYLW